jgi:hypothetical protein
MNLLLTMMIYLIVGCGEWYLALRRTLACARGEKVLLVTLVFIENLLGLWVLSNFIRTNNWTLALCYSAGASAGALIVAMNTQVKPAKAVESIVSTSSRSESDLAPAQSQRMLFEMTEAEDDSDHKASRDARTGVYTFHRVALKGLKSAQSAFAGVGRDRWRQYLPSRRRNGQHIEFSG